MTIRLLHLSDLHLDRVFAAMGCQGELARRRRQGLREALTAAGRLAMEQGCVAVTIGGDLYEHERAGVDTGRFLAETFASWQPMRVLIAPGNHDALLPGSLYRRVEWPENVTVFGSTELEPVELTDGVTIWGLAHREPAWQGDPLGGSPATSESGVHLALFHGAELGSRPEGKSIHGPFHAERIRAAGFAAALCGHYHRRRLDTASGLLYPGTPEPLSFDDEGGRGPVVVEIAGSGDVRFIAHDTNRWSVFTVACDADECGSAEAVIDEVTVHCAATGFGDPERTMIRVDLTGVDRLRDLARRFHRGARRCGSASVSPQSRSGTTPRRTSTSKPRWSRRAPVAPSCAQPPPLPRTPTSKKRGARGGPSLRPHGALRRGGRVAMILERIEITGFGCLHDVTSELHPRITVITGRNESGKSTLLRAVRGALYGIDAGGQGRAVDRSDWARYEPWTAAGTASRSPTSSTTDGASASPGGSIRGSSRFRSSSSADPSSPTSCAAAASVTPGRFHLGIDESVFCATAWLGDDGLRIDAPESARQRAGQLQEAIERLADTRRGVTAAQAMVRIREAMDRVGSERRATSPLGVASARLKTLERTIADARTRLAAVAVDQERLTSLDATLGAETERRIEAERARIAGRLAEVASRRRAPRRAGSRRQASGGRRSRPPPPMRASRSMSRPR